MMGGPAAKAASNKAAWASGLGEVRIASNNSGAQSPDTTGSSWSSPCAACVEAPGGCVCEYTGNAIRQQAQINNHRIGTLPVFMVSVLQPLMGCLAEWQ